MEFDIDTDHEHTNPLYMTYCLKLTITNMMTLQIPLTISEKSKYTQLIGNFLTNIKH
jgi:hypothetical protein